MNYKANLINRQLKRSEFFDNLVFFLILYKEENNLTFSQLAIFLNKNNSHLSRVINREKNVSIHFLFDFATLLGIELYTLIFILEFIIPKYKSKIVKPKIETIIQAVKEMEEICNKEFFP